MALHDAKELDNDLGRRSNEDLALSSALGIDDVVKTVVENGDANHDWMISAFLGFSV